MCTAEFPESWEGLGDDPDVENDIIHQIAQWYPITNAVVTASGIGYIKIEGATRLIIFIIDFLNNF